ALSSLQPRVPASLERLIRRCLAKDPEDRWQTARDMAAELRWIVGTSSVTAIPAPVKAGPARRIALGGGVAGAALTAAGFAATLALNSHSPSVANYQEVTYRKGAVSSARFTPDGRS